MYMPGSRTTQVKQALAFAPVRVASVRAALAQSTPFCTAGPPLTPIAPTIPSTLMGNPPPYARPIKLKKVLRGMPNRAALFCALVEGLTEVDQSATERFA
jgi:hypothetical protein